MGGSGGWEGGLSWHMQNGKLWETHREISNYIRNDITLFNHVIVNVLHSDITLVDFHSSHFFSLLSLQLPARHRRWRCWYCYCLLATQPKQKQIMLSPPLAAQHNIVDAIHILQTTPYYTSACDISRVKNDVLLMLNETTTDNDDDDVKRMGWVTYRNRKMTTTTTTKKRNQKHMQMRVNAER